MPFDDYEKRFRCCCGGHVTCAARISAVVTIIFGLFAAFNAALAYRHRPAATAVLVFLTAVISAASLLLWGINRMKPWALLPFLGFTILEIVGTLGLLILLLVSSSASLSLPPLVDESLQSADTKAHVTIVFVILQSLGCVGLVTFNAWSFLIGYRAYVYILEKQLHMQYASRGISEEDSQLQPLNLTLPFEFNSFNNYGPRKSVITVLEPEDLS